jgi:hypothetical protein
MGYNTIRSKFSKNIQLFNEEQNVSNDSENENYFQISTEIYDEEVDNCTSDEAATFESEQIVINTESESKEELFNTEPPIVPTDMVNIQMTPEEYKEYFIAVTERRKRIWEEQYGLTK